MELSAIKLEISKKIKADFGYSFLKYFWLTIGAFSLLVLGVLQSNAQPCVPLSKPSPQMGAHIQPEFTNLWNMINADYGANYGSANMGNGAGGHAMVYLGKDGWPREGKEHTMMANLTSDLNPNLKVKIGDLFHCKYRGTRSQITLASTDVTMENITESGGTVTFDFKVLSLGRVYFKINGRITDIQFMRPGYELDDPRMITDENKEYLKGLQVIRLMGQSGTNQNFESEWKYRTPPNAPFENFVHNGDENKIRDEISCLDERADNPWLSNSINQTRSYPWEKAIDLCNYLEMDFYASLPVLADLNYAHELAVVVKSRLKPTLNIYLEIGNEIWNFGGGGAFLGAPMLGSAIYRMVEVEGDRTIMGDLSKGIALETESVGNGKWWGGSGFNAFGAMRRWPSYRLKQFMDEFAKEFGFADQGGVGGRIRAVLAGQKAYGWGGDYWFIGNEGVFFLEKQFGAGTAKKYLYALAVATYTNVHDDPSKSIEEATNLSVDEIIGELDANTNLQFGEFGEECQNGNCEGNEYEDLLGYAKRYGLRVIAYEGGPESNLQRNGAWIPMKNIVAAYNSPGMYNHIKTFMTKWYSWMGYDAIYIKNGFYTTKGYGAGYAVAEKMGDISPQYQAYRDIMDNPAPPLTKERGGVIGVETVTILEGKRVAAFTKGDLTGDSRRVVTYIDAAGNLAWSNAIYLLRNETSAKYKLSLEYNYGGGEGKKFEVLLNDKIITTIDVPFSFGNPNKFSAPILLDIPYGTHALVIRVPSTEKRDYGFNIYNLKFEIANENPPAMPDQIYGDLVVCKGNTKAKYEVSPVDFSVCDYEWTGLPTSASILPATTAPSSGQGAYKMYVDWGNTPNGTYDLTVVAKNQSKLPGNAWLTSPERKFKVTIQTCGFEIDKSPICINEDITFTPTPMAGVTEYRWDLGQGATPNRAVVESTSKAVKGRYTSVGKIDVKLTTKNAAGEDKIYFNVVNVISCNSPIVVSPLKYCKGSIALPLTAEATTGGTNLKWYTSASGGPGSSTAPIPSTSAAGSTSYWVTQMNNGGTVESLRSKIEVIVSDAPPVPTVGTITPYCIGASSQVEDITSKLTLASGAAAKWYSSNTATTSTNAPTAPSTAAANEISWYVSQSIGTCESPKVELKVSVVAGPSFTSIATDPSTCGQKGKITLSGLTPNASYKVSYNSIAPASFVASATGEILIENLASGPYSNIKVDNSVCASSDNKTHTIKVPETAEVIATGVNPTSCGLADGKIVLKGLSAQTSYKIGYTRNSETQPLKNLVSSAGGELVIVELGGGIYGDITIVPESGTLCLSGELDEVTLTEVGAPPVPTITG
ncbi:MAG TPA: PKD domain-containing protein, partial [Cytophagaceae bacterium]